MFNCITLHVQLNTLVQARVPCTCLWIHVPLPKGTYLGESYDITVDTPGPDMVCYQFRWTVVVRGSWLMKSLDWVWWTGELSWVKEVAGNCFGGLDFGWFDFGHILGFYNRNEFIWGFEPGNPPYSHGRGHMVLCSKISTGNKYNLALLFQSYCKSCFLVLSASS